MRAPYVGLGLGIVAFLLSGCAYLGFGEKPMGPQFEPAQFSDLPGYANDDLSDMAIPLMRSCARMMKQDESVPLKHAGSIADWSPFCTAIAQSGANPRTEIERHLRPWAVQTSDSKEGLFTGYYEASLRGSLVQGGVYQTPIRARPLDHVIVDLGDFKEDWKGQRVTGQLMGVPGALVLKPYPERAQIVARGASGVDRVLAWVADPADAFFLEIQGSGRITLEDGTVLRVGYDDRNGQPYTATGKILVERGVMTRDQASMQSIRAWMANNPDAAQALMNENKSYIFFRALDGDGPIGAQGVALTALRSLAVDKNIWSYGVPFYLDAAGAYPNEPRLQRLMVAQDTGGAIRGVIRGDVFWGFGDVATAKAGVMKSRGTYWILLPLNVRPGPQ